MKNDKKYLQRLYEAFSFRNRIVFQLYCLAGVSLRRLAEDLGMEEAEASVRLEQMRNKVLQLDSSKSQEDVKPERKRRKLG